MANLFGQLGDLYKMQKDARAMQKKMKQVSVSGLSKNEDVEIIIDGTQAIIEMGIDDKLLDASLKTHLIKSIKEAMQDAQKKLQKKMMEDFDISDLKNMLSQQ